MEAQNYANHRRLVPGFHFFTSALAVILFALAGYKLFQLITTGQWVFSDLIYTGIVPLIIAVVLIMLFIYTRQFVTKVQDRAIRAEENLRHFILTGRPLDHRLSLSQVVALRFAHDDEYLPMIQRAINENLSGEDIKKSIKNWRADHHRA